MENGRYAQLAELLVSILKKNNVKQGQVAAWCHVGAWAIRIGLAQVNPHDRTLANSAEAGAEEEVVVVIDAPYTSGPTTPATPPKPTKEG